MQTIDYIRLYKIDKYGEHTNDVLERDFSESYPYDLIAGDIEEEEKLNKKLKKNKGYHYQYKETYDCIAYGDIDKCETRQQVIDILSYICDMYDIETDNMAYTMSNPKPNSYGTHWTIPIIRTNMTTLKIRMKEVGEKFNINGVKYVDTSVYKKSGFLRLPRQTNEDKPTKHKIIQGKPIDFLLHYVFNCWYSDYKEEVKIEPKKSVIAQYYEPNYKLLDELTNEFHSDYSSWRNMSYFMKNLNYSVDDFIKYSRGKNFSGEDKCIKMWNATKVKEGITEAYFYARLKETKPEVFAVFNSDIKIDYVPGGQHNPLGLCPITKFINEEDIITISNRHLIAETNSKLTDMKDILTLNIHKFFNSNTKSFSIKSPYDTGKTCLLKKIFTKYQPKKILWLSYRKTLTNDILGSFADDYNFKDYQKKEYDADRLIIQLESTMKLKPHIMFLDDEEKIPSYDLIIIDEIESILSHFDSPTFKNQSRETFNWICEIIKVSNKIIALDGDIGNRTYNFLNYFGTSTNIVNDIKINKRSFSILSDKEPFYKKLIDDIQSNKKIVICSMSSKKCSDIYDMIKEKFPNKQIQLTDISDIFEKKYPETYIHIKKKYPLIEDITNIIREEYPYEYKLIRKGNIPSHNIKLYTGKTDDKNKDDLLDVNKYWSECDILIYSPTIESGVNFDMVHFDKMYGIICLHSTSQRAFCQMLSRVRKIKDTTITILNANANLILNPITDKNKYNYDEVKNSLINLNVINSKEIITNGNIKKELELYDSNYVFNKIETLYKNEYYFLGQLKSLVESKGHDWFFDGYVPKKENKKKKKGEEEIEITDELLGVKDITTQEYKDLIQKQSESIATAEDKLRIKKYVFKKCVGVDILNQEIIDDYDFSTIKKYIGLIDKRNIKQTTDNKYTEEIKRVEIINQLINNIGFENLYDKKSIDENELLSNIKDMNIFKDAKSLRILFDVRTIQKDFDTTKSLLGCVNSMLKPYSIKIQSTEITVKQEKTYVYYLTNIKGREYIEELLQYRINKGLKIEGNRVYEPTDHYIKLIKPKTEEDSDDENDEEVVVIKPRIKC